MHVAIKDGGDGVPCWNRSAVMAHADAANRREQQVAERNPDVVVLPGRLVCYGCEVMEYDYGIKCTASLTRTRYAVQGETEPRAEDAAGSLWRLIDRADSAMYEAKRSGRDRVAALRVPHPRPPQRASGAPAEDPV